MNAADRPAVRVVSIRRVSVQATAKRLKRSGLAARGSHAGAIEPALDQLSYFGGRGQNRHMA